MQAIGFMEVLALIGVLSPVLAFLTYRKGLHTEVKKEAQNQGELETDIKYIKSGIDDIKRTVAEHETKIWDLAKDVAAINASVRSAHHRIDGIQKRGE